MKPRVTLNMTRDGELQIWINEAGRDLLARELAALDEKNDHVHLFPGGEIDISTKAYDPTDTIIWSGKVLFRKDEWDKRHFPHVFDDKD